MKKLLSTFLALSLTLSLCTISAFAVEFDGGSGTQNDPYLISSAAQLLHFRDRVNAGEETICAKLINNVDMQSQDWDAIGLSERGYCGVFDGCGYAVRNLNINRVSSGTNVGNGISTLYGGGLFGIVGRGGTVKHVNVDAVISVNETMEVNPDIGSICGGNFGIIEECFATCDFRDFDLTIISNLGGRTNLGGIAGVNCGTIKNCYSVGSMDVKVTYEKMVNEVYAGGLVGRTLTSGTTVENCYSAMTIAVTTNANYKAGGIFGALEADGSFCNLYTDAGRYTEMIGKKESGTLKNSEALPTADMKTPGFVKTLGSAFRADTDKVNQGYPVLGVMAYEEESDSSKWFDDELGAAVQEEELFHRLTPPELSQRDLTKAITRAEFCAVAVKLYEELGGMVYDASKLENPFADVSSDAVLKAYRIGITNGTSTTTFEPYAAISRQDMATMLTRVYKAKGIDGWTLAGDSAYTLDYSGVTAFDDDADIFPYAKSSVYFMVKNGIVKGASAAIFAPLNRTPAQEAIGYANATREQAIILSIRMFTKFGR